MEPKLIKEEAPDRESTSSCKELAPRRQATPPGNSEAASLRGRHKGHTKERVKTPDSPEGARLMPAVATPSGSPLDDANPRASPTTSRLQNGVPTSGTTSPLLNGSVGSGGSLTPPLPASMSVDAQTGGAGTRTLGKMKRFLSTLVQFGGDIAPDTGDRVRQLVFSLVGNGITVEEFHHSLQDVTNFPLRPFVVPFLRAHLPLLQRELNSLARTAKQSPQQYLRHHEHVVLDPAFSPSEPSEIFQHSEINENGKRRLTTSYYENGSVDACTDYLSPAAAAAASATKRTALHHPHLQVFSPGYPPPPHLHPSADAYPQPQQLYAAYPGASEYMAERRHGDDEWKNIHVMLNCILSMVEKTKRALAILQHRGENGSASADWLRRPTSQADSNDIKRTAGEIMAQTIRVTEDRVAEVKRRAEEAVNEVKRQAVAELQRAVTAAESKACELVATERAKMEKLLLEARKQAAEEALAAVVAGNSQSQQPEVTDAANALATASQQNKCWNCGRKANETCSGCNMARYCGAFCQHKDWENHHQVCCGRTNQSEVDKPQPARSRSVTPSSSVAPSDTRTKK